MMRAAMSTPIELFSYDLPPERIAQASIEPRDHSRLMALDRQTGACQHRQFFQILDELRAGDLLVLNDSKVFRARLHGQVWGKTMELFLLRRHPGADGRQDTWETLLKPGRIVAVGDQVVFENLVATILEKKADGVVWVSFDQSFEGVLAYADAHGEIPTPPYVRSVVSDLSKYQTVYAKETGSVAAPTAGFHFTPELFEKIKAKGVQVAFVTLHVGIGTFRPVKTETLEEHEMHREFVQISKETAALVNAAKYDGRRVIAVGTTTVRTLEGVAAMTSACPRPTEQKDNQSYGRASLAGGETKTGTTGGLPEDGFAGDVNLFITPGFAFRVVDALITNFHLPKSTLLVLVSAFAGREQVLAAYGEAIKQEYRFFSFGDAMFIR